MDEHLVPQSLGSIVRNAALLYAGNWQLAAGLCLVPLAPLDILKSIAVDQQATVFVFVLGLAESVATIFAVAALTVAMAAIVTGERPDFQGCWRRAAANPGRLVGAYLWVALYISLGTVALILPGIVAMVRYLFVLQVAVLEGEGGRAALARSRDLGAGFFLRNLGIFLVQLLFVGLFRAVAVRLLGAMLGSLVGLLAWPYFAFAMTQLYFDMRVRKESYGAHELAAELAAEGAAA